MASTWRSSSSLLHSGSDNCSSSCTLLSNIHVRRVLQQSRNASDLRSCHIREYLEGRWLVRTRSIAGQEPLTWRLQLKPSPTVFRSGRFGRYVTVCSSEPNGGRFESEGGPQTDFMYRGGWQNPSEQQRPLYDYAPPRESRGGPPRPPGDPRNGTGQGGGFFNVTTSLVLAAFIIGIGTGVWFATEVNFYPSNVASTELIDRKTPNTEICMANGYASMVFDQRLFVSFNPFNVYVSQPEVKPGCVLRRSNIRELERRNLIKSDEVAECTKKMNTFAFVGDLEGDEKHKPEISCVYHSEDAENMFLKNPKAARMGDGVADAAD